MKKLIAIILSLTFVLALVGCSSKPKTFDITGAEKLTIRSGATGESIDITNTEDIKYITDNINALKYSKGEKVNSDGWSYNLQWFDENGEIIENLTLLGGGYTIIYDGYYYKGMEADYEIDLAFLDSQFAKNNAEVTETKANDELPDKETFVATNIYTTESKPLVAEDGLTIADILESGTWNTEGTADCASNIEITVNGATYKYHSDCGTFNDNANKRNLSLDEETKETVNTILTEYVSLTATDVPVE